MAAIPHDIAAALDHGGEMGRRIRELDWASTPVGAMSDWPAELRSALSFMLASRAQIAMFWGPDYIAFYNDAYAPTIGEKDRTALGRPARDGWSELWSTLEPMLDSVVETLEPFAASDHPFEIARHGFIEDVFFDISYDPILLPSGEVGGVFCIVSETTVRVVGERRLRMVHELARELPSTDGEDEVAELAVELLCAQPADIELAGVYLRGADGGVHLAGPAEPRDGLPAELAASSRLSIAWTRAVDGQSAVEITGSWRSDVDAVPTRPTILHPLLVRGDVVGGLVVTPSARQPFDDAHRTFLGSLAAEIARALAEVRGRAEDRRRADALAELDRAKTDFFSNISHEFRTPLTLLLGPLRDALDDQSAPLEGRQRERVALAERNAERLLRLVNRLLEFSRYGEGASRPRIEALDIGEATSSIVELFGELARRAGIDLRLEVSPITRPTPADPSMFEIVVLNLLSNAFKHTLEGSITVSVTQDRSDAVVTVSDTGSGIPAEALEHVFDRFHRIAGVGGRTFESTGIGLALVHEIVDAHGGSVTATSDVGVGSTFEVRLPLAPAEPDTGDEPVPSTVDAHGSAVSARYLADVTEIVDTTNGATTTAETEDATGEPGRGHADGSPDAEPESGGNSDGGTVLVVDDNADMRHYLRQNLEPYFEVIVARNGEDGIEKAREVRPDLVLTDVMMPGLDGIGLLAALRADDALRNVPVVLVSARPGEDLAVEALEVGADDYLIKPFSVLELVTRVRSAVQLARSRTERERDAQLYAAHFEAVAQVAQQLNASRTWRDISTTLSTSLVPIVRCDEVSLLVVAQETTDILPPAKEDRLSPELAARWRTWTGNGSPVHEAVLRRRRMWLSDRSQLATRYPALAETVWDTDLQAMAVLPLGLGDAGEVLGALWIGWHRDVRPEPILVGMIDTVTQLTAQAAARARDFESERAVARTLQESVLPGAPPDVDQMSIAWRYASGTRFMTVGGDWYDAIPIPGGGVALVVGDVVGHGAASAASMAQLRNSLRGYLALGAGPAEALGQLNDLVHTTQEDHFATVCCLVVAPDRRSVTWSSAGHPPVVLRRPDGGVELLEGGRGVPIGAFPFSQYEASGVDLEAGSTMVLYTDGLVESRAHGYSTDPLAACIAGAPDPTAGALLDTVFAELVGEDREDDIAAVVVRITAPIADLLSFEVDAEPRSVGQVRHRIREHVESRMTMDEDTLSGLLVAVSEAVTNAVEHRRTDGDVIAVSAQVDGARIEITVSDQGVWRPPVPQATRGFGLSIMRALTDVTVDPTPRGTTVTMRAPKAVAA
ncbi:MAG: SpoIIE family protein phosphatase [Actinomycetota bacterium]|nr:SpoIIE family protein phosphatase [Actinomycetota bacterium]